MYRQAMALAPNAMEKRGVLSGLSAVASADALKMAAGYLDDKELVQEAEVAVVRIAQSIYKEYPQQSADLLKKVIATTKNEAVRQQAEDVMNPPQKKADAEEAAS
jgi:hypothetical protein